MTRFRILIPARICSAILGEMRVILQKMLDSFQKIRRYDALDPNAEVYREKFLAIACVELVPLTQRTKWNVGQTKPKAAFGNILDQLRVRGVTTDGATAEAMERWYKFHKTPAV